jgi:iron(III) transport system ATP-binding protein
VSAELNVERLRKVFMAGGKVVHRPAIDDVSFTIPAGEITVLLGPSGCGKTTTLRCVAGLEHPTSGVIRIGGEMISAPEQGIMVPPRHRDFGMVFQSYAVWPHMTVRQNVAYPLRHRRLGRAESAKRVAEALALVDLAHAAERPVVSLSGGQMQRVALARSMVYQPRLLLLDEPLSNLDAQLRLRLRDDLRRIIKRAGLTALYVTHDQTEAVVLGDRIGVMRDGRLLQLATATELYNRPADLFVANFTGSSNVIPGRVVAQDGENGTVEASTGERLLTVMPAGASPGDPVHVAIRPENVRLATGSADGTGNCFPARVVAAHYQGNQTVYELDTLGARVEVLEIGSAPRHAEGMEIALTLPPAHCLAYAAGT